MHSEICPVCKGKGKVKLLDVMIRDGRYTKISLIPFPVESCCNGCGGKGWIEVKDHFEYIKVTSAITIDPAL